MNVFESEILIALKQSPFRHQRELAARCGLAVGTVNKALRALTAEGLLSEDQTLTPAAEALLESLRPRRAVILAAGTVCGWFRSTGKRRRPC